MEDRCGHEESTSQRHPSGLMAGRPGIPIATDYKVGVRNKAFIIGRAGESIRYNVVTIVAWAGVGKSTLVNHWLRRMGTHHYRSAELIFGWSFYRQGPVARLHPRMNFWTQPSPGLEMPTRGWARPGRKAN